MVNRVHKYGLSAGACLLALLLQISPAGAVSYSQKSNDGHVCRFLVTPHLHVGVGTDRHSERAARAAAVRRWKSFTRWEYGSGWDNVGRARHRNFACAQVLGGWKCLFTAQPCRR